MSELTSFKNYIYSLPTFKNDLLTGYTREIIENMNKGIDVAKDIAYTLGHVKSSKCYLEDGFTSVSDYAEKVFGIKRTQAYQQACVGERMGKNEIFKELPLANAAELLPLSDVEITDALTDGNIMFTMNQRELRDAVKSIRSNSKASKPANPKKYLISVFGHGLDCVDETTPMTEDDIMDPEWLRKYDDRIKLPTVKGIDGQTIKRWLFLNTEIMEMALVLAIEYKDTKPKPAKKRKSKKTEKAAQKYTMEELKAMLAAKEQEDANV